MSVTMPKLNEVREVSIHDFIDPKMSREDWKDETHILWMAGERYRLVYYWCQSTWRLYHTFPDIDDDLIVEESDINRAINVFNEWIKQQ